MKSSNIRWLFALMLVVGFAAGCKNEELQKEADAEMEKIGELILTWGFRRVNR
ncbi:MAG: hypothetical protein R3C03_11665 [Pirellulaceae bacterium]